MARKRKKRLNPEDFPKPEETPPEGEREDLPDPRAEAGARGLPAEGFRKPGPARSEAADAEETRAPEKLIEEGEERALEEEERADLENERPEATPRERTPGERENVRRSVGPLRRLPFGVRA